MKIGHTLSSTQKSEPWDSAVCRASQVATKAHEEEGRPISPAQGAKPHLAFSDFLFSPPISTPGTIQVKGCRETKEFREAWVVAAALQSWGRLDRVPATLNSHHDRQQFPFQQGN